MLATLDSCPSDSLLVAALNEQVEFFDGGSPPDTLIVTSTDSRLDRCALPTLCDDKSLLLRVPGLSLTDDGVWEAIAYAVEHLDIQHLVICGHSQSASRRHNTPPFGRSQEPGADRIGQRTAELQRGIADAKTELAQQLEWLASQELIASKIATVELGVVGLFYLLESGAFMAYEGRTGQFAPLRLAAAVG